MAAQTLFVVGIDLGQEGSHSAVVALEYPEYGERTYLVRHAQRFPLGTRYSEVVERIVAPLARPPLIGRTLLAIDATGVGAPNVEQIENSVPRGTRCVPIIITPGDTVNTAEGRTKVPKRDLVGTTEVLLQNGRLRVGRQLHSTAELVDELLDFRRRISDAGHDSYGPSSSAGRDDLVMALSLACWAGENRGTRNRLIVARPNRRQIPTLSPDTLRGMGRDFLDDRDF